MHLAKALSGDTLGGQDTKTPRCFERVELAHVMLSSALSFLKGPRKGWTTRTAIQSDMAELDVSISTKS